jgi:hypothetical protein
VTQRAPDQPAPVLGQVVERDPKLAPVGHLEGQMVEVRVAPVHERDRVVIGAQAQPGAGVAEPVAHAHAEDVAVEIAHLVEVGGQHVHVAEPARMEPAESRRRASNRRSAVVLRLPRQELDPEAVGIREMQSAVVAAVVDAERVELRRCIVERHVACQLEAGVVGARRIRADELERVGLVGAGEVGAVTGALSLDQPELDRPPPYRVVELRDSQADMVDSA